MPVSVTLNGNATRRPAAPVYRPTPPRPAPARRLPGIARSEVQQGQLFRKLHSDTGRPLSTALYGAVGMNGKLFSIRIDNGDGTSGAAASSKNPDGRVEVVGTYSFKAEFLPQSEHRVTARDQLPDNAIFRVKTGGNGWGKKQILNLGKLDDGTFLGVNLAKWPSQDHVRGRRANKTCVMIGTYTLTAKTKPGVAA